MYNYGPYAMRAFRNERKFILTWIAVRESIVTFLVSIFMALLGVSFSQIIRIVGLVLGISVLGLLVLNFLIRQHQYKYGGD